ncbi:MAG: PTS system mannose/fructose/sorbose family transporter subunit IID [Longimicrobiales bacterium]
MTALSRKARLAVFARSFAIQGSFNYRTLIGNGFAFALLPALREIFRGRPADFREAVERHSGLFNSHPYLSGIALGAVATLEDDGANPAVVERFKSALRGSLGSLGDSIVWAGWRPVCALLALLLLLFGAPWWVVVLVFLTVYNAGHLALRGWAFRLGFSSGREVGEQLRRAPLSEVQRGVARGGAFLLGCLLPLAAVGGLVSGRPLPVVTIVLAAVAAIIGLAAGHRVRTPVVLALAGFMLVGLVYEVVS